MNIIELAREWFPLELINAMDGDLIGFANAVIKAHTEELIDGAGEPQKIEQTDQYGDAYGYTATQVAAAVAKKDAEITNLHTVMMAAAVEITEHWDAHCDEEGYGPANLVRRLENCYPAQYGYDSQTVVRMEKRIATLESTLRVALEVLAINQYAVADQAPHKDVMNYNATIEKIEEVLHG